MEETATSERRRIMKNYTTIPATSDQEPAYEIPIAQPTPRPAQQPAGATSAAGVAGAQPTPRPAQQPNNTGKVSGAAGSTGTASSTRSAGAAGSAGAEGSTRAAGKSNRSYEPQNPDSTPNGPFIDPLSPDAAQKIKGAGQMAAGAAVAAAGIPMLILPGPGAAAIAGGVALASKGQRNFSGREATAVEEKLDAAADKMVAVAKEQAEATAQKVATEAPIVAEKAARKVEAVAESVSQAASERIPVVISSVEENMPAVADAARRSAAIGKDLASIAANTSKVALDKAPEAVRKAAFGLDAMLEMGRASLDEIAKAQKSKI